MSSSGKHQVETIQQEENNAILRHSIAELVYITKLFSCFLTPPTHRMLVKSFGMFFLGVRIAKELVGVELMPSVMPV